MGIMVYKCYERDKLRDRYGHDDDRKMFDSMYNDDRDCDDYNRSSSASSASTSLRETELPQMDMGNMNSGAMRAGGGGAEWIKRTGE